MERCSYTWVEVNEIGVCTEHQCQEKTWTNSERFCILHDPSPIKNNELFRQRIEEKLDSSNYNFQGCHFLEGWKFDVKQFGGEADFRGAIFQKNSDFKGVTFLRADFRKTRFLEDVDFSRAIFRDYANFNGSALQNSNFVEAVFNYSYFQRAKFKNADFWKVKFMEKSDFGYAHFQNAEFRDANFDGASFQNADFERAIFKGNMRFLLKKVEKLNLRGVQFLFKGHFAADLAKTRFHRADLEKVAFIDCIWPDKIYEEIHIDDEDVRLTYSELETIYRNLKQNMQNHGDYSRAGEFYFREMEMRRKGSKTKKKRMWLEVYHLLAGYGEKPERTILSSLFTIILFALLYWVLECLDYSKEGIGNLEEIIYTLYFSFVTFTTLGLGDIEPLTHTGRILICCEAVIGAFLIALFVVVFAKKMMR